MARLSPRPFNVLFIRGVLMEIRCIMRTIFHPAPSPLGPAAVPKYASESEVWPRPRNAIVHDAIIRGNLAESSGGSPRDRARDCAVCARVCRRKPNCKPVNYGVYLRALARPPVRVRSSARTSTAPPRFAEDR